MSAMPSTMSKPSYNMSPRPVEIGLGSVIVTFICATPPGGTDSSRILIDSPTNGTAAGSGAHASANRAVTARDQRTNRATRISNSVYVYERGTTLKRCVPLRATTAPEGSRAVTSQVRDLPGANCETTERGNVTSGAVEDPLQIVVPSISWMTTS